MPIFTLTVNARTTAAGENASQERSWIAGLLVQAAQQISSGSSPFNAQNVPEPGWLNPTNCSWSFGPGSKNEPCNPKSGTTAGGTAVVINGIGFTGLTGARFGGVAATSFSVTNDGQITCVSPAHAAGAVDVELQKGGVTQTTLPQAFTFT